MLKTILTIRRPGATDGARFQLSLFDRAGLLSALENRLSLPEVTDHELILIGAQGNSTARLDQEARTAFITLLCDCLESISSGTSAMRWSWSSRTGERGQRLTDVMNVVTDIRSEPSLLKPKLQIGEKLSAQRLDNGNSAFAQYCSIPLSPTLGCRLLRDLTLRSVELDRQGFQLEVDDGTATATRANGEVVQSLSKIAAQSPGNLEDIENLFRTAPEASTLAGLLRAYKNVVIEGVPGTGKSHSIESARTLFDGPTSVVVMHPSTSYEDMIEGVRPAAGSASDGSRFQPAGADGDFARAYGTPSKPADVDQAFCIRAGRFLLACANACNNPNEDHLIVLDELNRCNVPRAFGELLLLLEPSKRRKFEGGAWRDGQTAILPYSGLTFFVPDNLHVLGTMNTTDRSVAPLDQALRRRFAFHRLEPMEPDALKTALGERAQEPSVAAAIDAWHALNHELENKLGPDMMLGHSYFFDAKRAMERGEPADAAIRDMWRFAILPQLIDILHSANKSELAKHQKLVSHLESLDLELKLAGEGLHALLRVRSTDSKANS